MSQTSGFFSPFLRNKRIAAIKPFMQPPVLDFGCASGVLAQYFSPDDYIGVDIDAEALTRARTIYPLHSFYSPEKLSDLQKTYNSIILLAVLEHVTEPCELLRSLSARLTPQGSIIITTPHPSWQWVHAWGSDLGLFSKEAKEEHKDFIDLPRMTKLAKESGLSVTTYRRFLCNANQLFVLRKQ